MEFNRSLRKNALGQLGDDDEHPESQQRLMQFIRVLGETEQIDYLLEREAFHGHRWGSP